MKKCLAETTGLEPAKAFSPDCLANSYGYRFVTSLQKKELERMAGFEPAFADLQSAASIRLATSALKNIGKDDGTRTR